MLSRKRYHDSLQPDSKALEPGEKGEKRIRAANGAISTHGDYICDRCRAIDLDAVFRTEIDRRKSGTFGTFICHLGKMTDEWLRSRCSLCRLSAAVHTPTPRSKPDQEYSVRAFSSLQRCKYKGSRKDIKDTIALSIFPDGTVAGRGSRKAAENEKIRYGTSNLLYPVSQGLSPIDGISGHRILTTGIDYEILRDWIDFCDHHHIEFCQQKRSDPVPGFRLINCSTRNIVLASKSDEYVALSYVWGPEPPILWDDYDQLPPHACNVVEDAILVALGLGIRHLWVDRYCIRQSQAEEKHTQIRNIDKIYAKAKATVVASAGEDSSFGLPGVSQRARKAQPHARIGSHVLVSTMSDPRMIVKNSKWATRAWTYQEAILSCRRLFFTEEQVLFEYNTMTCQKTISVPRNKTLLRSKRAYAERRIFPRIGINKRNWKSELRDETIESCISAYSTRSLSFSSDALNGILGVFKAFEGTANGYQL